MIHPMFAMFLLTAFVLVRLFGERVRSVREGEIGIDYFRVYQGGVEPVRSAQLARQFTNLFEAPVLFYAVCLAAMVTRHDTELLRVLAWGYVLLRVGHAWVHLTANRIRWRVRAYMGSWIVLASMWCAMLVT